MLEHSHNKNNTAYYKRAVAQYTPGFCKADLQRGLRRFFVVNHMGDMADLRIHPGLRDGGGRVSACNNAHCKNHITPVSYRRFFRQPQPVLFFHRNGFAGQGGFLRF